MKSYFKYSILVTLSLLIASSLVYAQPAIPIGQSQQFMPYESNPTAIEYFMVGAPLSTDKDNMKDGIIATSGSFFLGGPHIIRPNGDGNYKAWSEVPAGAGFLAWYQESPDGDTTYVYSATAAQRESSTLDDPPAGASGTISSVTVWINAKRTGTTAGSLTPFLRLGGVDLSGTAITTMTTSYASYSRVIGRPGGGTWTWADIQSLEAGVLCTTVPSGGQFRVTQLYVEVAGPTAGYFAFSFFTNTPSAGFPIGWVDIKMKYSVSAATVDDSYKIEYTTDGVTWADLQPSVRGDPNSLFDPGGGDSLGRVWSQAAEPTDTLWDWTDLGNLRISVSVTQAGGSWDNVRMFVFEVWATIYARPFPPKASTALSIQPPAVYGLLTGQQFFVDVYAADVQGLWGWQYWIEYDKNVLTPTEVWTYWPFKSPAITTVIDDTAGYVAASYYTFSGDTVGLATTNTTVSRIYFTVDTWGQCTIDIVSAPPAKITELKPVGLPGFVPPLYDGWFASPHYMSAQPPTIIDPTAPISTRWHELYPTYSKQWHLTSWNDTQAGTGLPGGGYLSACDQIDMTDETDPENPMVHYFHVDAVTITIHFTFKPLPGDPGKAEPESPTTEMPPALGSRWHMIYPTYCRLFTITSHTDTDGDFYLDPSEQFDFEYDDEPGTTYWAHLDAISTDILVSEKPIEPHPPVVPEFPLGTEIIMALALAIPIIYIWRARPKRRVIIP